MPRICLEHSKMTFFLYKNWWRPLYLGWAGSKQVFLLVRYPRLAHWLVWPNTSSNQLVFKTNLYNVALKWWSFPATFHHMFWWKKRRPVQSSDISALVGHIFTGFYWCTMQLSHPVYLNGSFVKIAEFFIYKLSVYMIINLWVCIWQRFSSSMSDLRPLKIPSTVDLHL